VFKANQSDSDKEGKVLVEGEYPALVRSKNCIEFIYFRNRNGFYELVKKQIDRGLSDKFRADFKELKEMK